MVAEIGDPTEDTVKGAMGTVPETQRDRTMGTAQDLVAKEVVTLVGDRTEITVEAEVCEGRMVKTPTPPTRTDRECMAAVRTVGVGVGWCRENSLIGGVGKLE